MSNNHFIGRQNSIGQLTDALNKNSKQFSRNADDSAFRILSVWGKAGVGKTSLLEHALNLEAKSLKKQLIIRAGKSKFPQSIASIIANDFIRGVENISEETFQETLACRKIIQNLDIRAINRAIKDVPNKTKQDQIRNILIKEVGLLGVRFISKQTETILRESPVFNESADKLINSFQDRNPTRMATLTAGLGIKNRSFSLQVDAERELADSFLKDIRTILLENKRESNDGFLKNIRNTVFANKYEKNSLLIIIDDFEALEPILERFLLHFLLKSLENENFRTLVIIVGRDELPWTTDWDKFNHCKIDSIGLDVFDEPEAKSLLYAMGIYDNKMIGEILEKSYRLPLLLEVLAQAYASGQQSRWVEDYFQRITYQMTEKQKEWLQALCFLDVRVDEDTIKKMLPESDAHQVLDWFKSEASARISTKDGWQVDPIVKTILRDRVSQESLRRKNEYQNKAEVAQQEYFQLLSGN